MNLELRDKHVLIVGLGLSGRASAEFCCRQGARVTVTDQADDISLTQLAEPLKALGCRMELGQHAEKTFLAADLLVLSPGVDHRLPSIEKARQRRIPVIGEIELASRYIKEPIVAVTGTNGKTTTTTLIGDMLTRSGVEVFVGGNIGQPLIDYVNRSGGADLLVAEISSFQLDTIERFRPQIAVLLNISEDHLDRYDGMDAYVASKMRIFENQQAEDVAIVNNGDAVISAMAHRIKGCRLNVFPRHPQLDPAPGPGAHVTTAGIVVSGLTHCRPINSGGLSADETDPFTVARSDIGMTGEHNLENAAAATLAALNAGATEAGVKSALASFKGLPHRMEKIGRFNGIRFINDSKATNLDAVIRALQSIPEPVVLIMGGRSKDSDFKALGPSIRHHVKGIVAMGENRSEIARTLGQSCRTVLVTDMAAAVAAACRMAQSGDVVLLSPGCASFDMYSGYAQRGQDFKNRVAAHQPHHSWDNH